MPLDIQGTVDNLAASLRIVPSAPLPTQFGDPLSLKVIPSLSDLKATDTLLGALSPVPVAIPVSLTLRWELWRFDQTTLTWIPLQQDEHYLVMNRSVAPEVTFLFGLEGPEGLTYVRARAHITVVAIGASRTVSPEVELLVPTLDVPPVAVFFRRNTFNTPQTNRVVLVAVPMTVAAVGFEQVVEILRTLRELARKVRRIRRFVRMVTGIDLMLSAIRRQNTTVLFIQGDEIGEFPGQLGKWTSSIIWVGPARAWVECYVEEEGWQDPLKGQLNVGKTSKLIVLLPQLNSDPIQVIYNDGGADPVHPSGLPTKFGDCLKSARFVIPES
jgi:hypothetical protein